MTLFRNCVAALFCLVAVVPVQAHEFWLVPVAALNVGDSASLVLRVGEFFEGDLLGFSAQQATALQQFSAAGPRDLRTLLPGGTAVPALAVPVTAPGTHLFAYQSQPSFISLPADRFHAYLHDEGLDFIKVQREAEGTATDPGRERYRRFVKTLVRVADGPRGTAQTAGLEDKVYATETAQRLEIIPTNDPLALSPGGTLGLRVLFEKKPLEGALLKAWHKRGGQTLIIRAKTAADGTASFDLPYAGPWMVSVVHMVKVSAVKDVDWDSFWGNLSFVLRPKENTPEVAGNNAEVE